MHLVEYCFKWYVLTLYTNWMSVLPNFVFFIVEGWNLIFKLCLACHGCLNVVLFVLFVCMGTVFIRLDSVLMAVHGQMQNYIYFAQQLKNDYFVQYVLQLYSTHCISKCSDKIFLLVLRRNYFYVLFVVQLSHTNVLPNTFYE